MKAHQPTLDGLELRILFVLGLVAYLLPDVFS